MEHLYIFLLAVTIVLGIWASVYSFQLFNIYKYSFLQYLGRYVIYFSLFVLSQLAFLYIYKNIFNNQISPLVHWIVIFHKFFDFLTQAGIAYYLTGTILGFASENINNKFKNIFTTVIILLVFGYLLSFVEFYFSASFSTIIKVKFISNVLFYSFILSLLIYSIIRNKRIKDLNKRKSALVFSYSYLACYLAVIIILLFLRNMALFVTVLSLILNLLSLLWIKYSFIKNYIYPLDFGRKDQIISILFEKYDISKREGEIVELILQGKNNNEIENALFISVSTVKKHITSIYKKLGVKSRAQLMNMALGMLEKKPDSISPIINSG